MEPDPVAREAARRRFDLDVVSSVEALGDRAFDAIVLHHVVEHLPDPRRTIADLAVQLVPGGRLVLVTPNIESLGRRLFEQSWVHWDPPRHLHLFSRAALGSEVEQAGLNVERAFTTSRFARYVGAEGLRIHRTGRASPGRLTVGGRIAGALFQALEGSL